MENSYARQKLEGMSGAQIVIQSFFVMTRLMRLITKALQDQKHERAFLLSQQVRKILALLEVGFKEKKDPQLDEITGFILRSVDCLNEIMINSNPELSVVLEKSFKNFAVICQENMDLSRPVGQKREEA